MSSRFTVSIFIILFGVLLGLVVWQDQLFHSETPLLPVSNTTEKSNTDTHTQTEKDRIVAKESDKGMVPIAQIYSPKTHENISSPLIVSGEAPAAWFANDALEVLLLMPDQSVIARTTAPMPRTLVAVSPETMMPFEVHLEFDVVRYADAQVHVVVQPSTHEKTAPSAVQVVQVVPFTKEQSIHIELPIALAEISSPVELKGEAAGWYFEGSFPIDILGSDGSLLGQGYVTATEDWMQVGFVPFIGSVSFLVPVGMTTGTIRFMKDNPSAIPANDISVDFPVVFE